MNLHTALLQGQQLLDDAKISAPRLTAEVLLAHAIGCDRSWLFAHSDEELREVWWIHYGRYLHQRIQGVPTQYITGRQEFYGREFRVTPDVLIPRPETEHVIEAALQLVSNHRLKPVPRVLDVGTGSGAIAVTLALETGAQVFATDISSAALGVARENARRLSAKVEFVNCDLAGALADGYDLVVSNPPYVPETESLPIEVREHEPAVALYGGVDGYEIYRRLIPEAARLLKPGGWLVMELGYRSREAVTTMLGDWRDVEVLTDLAGLPRVVMAADKRR
ncbi:MAG TPA: peptide chain release factor N(5)-glutamine methyltransferase [Bryobacteraceae bacterium]|nr:peptide chain release factor N(5)-glutamine methyltransferase [Bryobacteraceae bacterium]